MKKLLIGVVIGLILVLGIAGVATAITNGQPDGDDHPYIGLVVFFNEDKVPMWRCSSSLIDEMLLLTAGHCTDGAAYAQVWFDEGPVPFDQNFSGGSCDEGGPYTSYPCAGGTWGTPYTNPGFCTGCGNGLPGFAIRDVGVVVLDEPVTGIGFATLPAAGLVDTLKNKTSVDLVGYGVQFQAQIPGSELPQPPPFYRWTGPRVRLYAPSEFVSGNFVHSAEFIRLSMNPGGGKGGTCFGDSGGPDLLGGTNTVLAVNSYVTNVNCSGVGYSSRVDIPEVLDWISDFMP